MIIKAASLARLTPALLVVFAMHLFAIQLPPVDTSSQTLDFLLGVVDAETRTRAQRFRLQEDCLRCLVGRLFVTWYLRSSLQRESEIIEIQRTPQGRPFLTKPILDTPFDYNISHDGGLVMLAVSQEVNVNVGVDVVKVIRDPKEARDLEEALEDQLHSTERAFLRRMVKGRSEALSKIWAVKEAYTKALGQGLGFEFSRIAVSSDYHSLTVDDRNLGPEWAFEYGVLEDAAGLQYVWASAARLSSTDPKEKLRPTMVDWQQFLSVVA